MSAKQSFETRGATVLAPEELGIQSSKFYALDRLREDSAIFWEALVERESHCLLAGHILNRRPGTPESYIFSQKATDVLTSLFQAQATQTSLLSLLGKQHGTVMPIYGTFNVMKKGDIIAPHVDNFRRKDIRAAVVFHLAAAERGGNFFVVPPGEPKPAPILVPAVPGTVVVSRGDVEHYVTKVEEGERITLAVFIGHFSDLQSWERELRHFD